MPLFFGSSFLSANCGLRVALLTALLLCQPLQVSRAYGAVESFHYTGDGTDLQATVDRLPSGATLVFASDQMLVLWDALVLRQPVTLLGLRARLPEGLGGISLVEVRAEDVSLIDLELHGNYATVSQDQRAPLVAITRGRFTVERATFFDSTKEGLGVTAEDRDIVGGVIRDISAYRVGRDAISLSGGNRGLKVRDVVIENVSLETSYLRGAVEVSDGADNIVVRNVKAVDAMYAVDIQDHREQSGSNTRVIIDGVEAHDCRYMIRTDNSPRGHAGLVLRNLTGYNIRFPLALSHTRDVVIENVTFTGSREWVRGTPAITVTLANCQNVVVRGLNVEWTDELPLAVENRYLGTDLYAPALLIVGPSLSPKNEADRTAFLEEQVARELQAAIAEDRFMTEAAAARGVTPEGR